MTNADDVLVLEPQDVLDACFLDSLQQAASNGARGSTVVVDMAAVKHVNSAALGGLIIASQNAKTRQVELVLSGMCREVREVFRVTALGRLFTIRE